MLRQLACGASFRFHDGVMCGMYRSQQPVLTVVMDAGGVVARQDTDRRFEMARKQDTSAAQEKLIDSVKTALDDAENLLRQAASETGDKAQELREEALESLKRTRLALYDVQDSVVEKGRQAVRATDEYVHSNPWQAITVSAAAGLLLGLLVSRR